jgi:cytochrome c biogenesis protein CcmG/thiol:disulfide interchange protein DsbE
MAVIRGSMASELLSLCFKKSAWFPLSSRYVSITGMPFLRRVAAWTAVAIAAAILVLFAMPSYRQGEASIAGKPAQDFPLTIAGKSEHLADLKGKLVVLNFWATWCPPCVEETPSLNRLQKYIDSRGGMVLGVSVDEDGGAYDKFLKDRSVVFPTYRDVSKKSAADYGTSMYPETYIIDRHGKIARKFVGPQQWDSPEMLGYFDAVLGQN